MESNETAFKSNEAFARLCEITTELSSQFGGRRAAFRAACAQYPDLAGIAIRPDGLPVITGSQGAIQVTPSTAMLDPLAARLAQAREDGAAEGRERAIGITAACIEYGVPLLAADFMSGGKSVTEVRQSLIRQGWARVLCKLGFRSQAAEPTTPPICPIRTEPFAAQTQPEGQARPWREVLAEISAERAPAGPPQLNIRF